MDVKSFRNVFLRLVIVVSPLKSFKRCFNLISKVFFYYPTKITRLILFFSRKFFTYTTNFRILNESFLSILQIYRSKVQNVHLSTKEGIYVKNFPAYVIILTSQSVGDTPTADTLGNCWRPYQQSLSSVLNQSRL